MNLLDHLHAQTSVNPFRIGAKPSWAEPFPLKRLVWEDVSMKLQVCLGAAKPPRPKSTSVGGDKAPELSTVISWEADNSR